MKNDETLFYQHREQFNNLLADGKGASEEAAALFYYLSRTGFNGLCRFNRSGECNVPSVATRASATQVTSRPTVVSSQTGHSRMATLKRSRSIAMTLCMPIHPTIDRCLHDRPVRRGNAAVANDDLSGH